MKGKIISFFSVMSIVSVLVTQAALAQTATPSPTPQTTELGQVEKEKIEDLKDRVATKVAELRTKTVYSAFVGEIKSADEELIVLTTGEGEKKVLLTEDSEIFNITRGRKTAARISNLKEGNRASVIGSKDSTGDFVAKVVLVKSLPLNINGVVTKIDRDNFTISVKGQKGTTYLVDIEATTKTNAWEKEKGFKKSGFSELKEGDRVHVNGTAVEDEENRILANRILVLPGLSKGITGGSPTPSASPSPTKSPAGTSSTPTP